MEFVSMVIDDTEFTIWQVGNWQHTMDHETGEHTWEWEPPERGEQRIRAKREFLAMTDPLFPVETR